MTIYNVKFYGVLFRYKQEYCGASMYKEKEMCHIIPGFDNFFFEVTVLKFFEGKEDVLKIQFENGEMEYRTLNAPFWCWTEKNKLWKKAKEKCIPEAFMKTYI